MNEPQVGIDIKNYAANKASGAITLAPAGKSKTHAFAFIRRFDPGTGEEMDPQAVPIGARALHAGIKSLQESIDGMQAMLADLKAIGIDTTPPKDL